MTIQAPNNFITSFDALVKQAYQGQEVLRNTVRLKTGVTGSSHKFPTFGKGMAMERVPQTDVVPMGLAQDKVTAILKDIYAADYSDVYDLSKLNYDEKSEIAKAVAAALGRKTDQLIIDALVASSTTNSVGTAIGGAASNLNIAKILRAKKLLDDNNVPDDGERYMVITPSQLETALAEDKVGSDNYNIMKALYEGKLNMYAGFKFKVIGNRQEGGLPKTSALRDCYAYHKGAIGLAEGISMRTEINYVPEKTSWLINGIMSAGSIAIDKDGIVKVQCTEA